MPLVALACPQCAAPLSRQAWWRMVTCSYCTAVVTHSAEVVQRAWFTDAMARLVASLPSEGYIVRCRSQRYRVLGALGGGTTAEVLLAETRSATPERVTLKLARNDAALTALQREEQVLDALQALEGPGAAYFTQRLPQAVGIGKVEGSAKSALVLRAPTGYWGSLAQVLHNFSGGMDPRHAVWVWRRMLEVLGFVHSHGWAHGRLSPDHLLVQPRDHGILIIGWSGAIERAVAAQRGRDLAQTAWTIRALLHGGDADVEPSIPASVPPPLAMLVRRASEDRTWCAHTGAQGIDDLLRRAAREAFGPPQFVPFHPDPQFNPTL